MKKVKAFTYRTVILTAVCASVVVLFGHVMGYANFFSTIMKTSHDLLLNTVFFIMAVCVLAGALGGFLAEFGVLALMNVILAPLTRTLWGLPGVSSVGAVSSFISDNPAILSLVKDENFLKYFRPYQVPLFINFSTSFGMGLIVTTFMMSHGFFIEPLIGLAGAAVGSIISTRLMQLSMGRETGSSKGDAAAGGIEERELLKYRYIRDDNRFNRLLESVLDGGKNGLEMSFQIIPGVLVICTMVFLMTFDGGSSGYNGSAYQGVPLLSRAGAILAVPLQLIFGFHSPDLIAYPVTALGAVGAALALVQKFITMGIAGGNEIAVFTAIGMSWSGFLSTHITMMNITGFRRLATRVILIHTLGGICAGAAAHYLYVLIT